LSYKEDLAYLEGVGISSRIKDPAPPPLQESRHGHDVESGFRWFALTITIIGLIVGVLIGKYL